MKIYQPQLIGKNEVPPFLYDHQVFADEPSCVLFMLNKHGWIEGKDYSIVEYDEEDIEDFMLLDSDGNPAPYLETEKNLDDAYGSLLEKVKAHGSQKINIEKTQLWTTLRELYGCKGNHADKYLQAVSVYYNEFTDSGVVVTEDDFEVRFDEIMDIDAFDELNAAVEKALS